MSTPERAGRSPPALVADPAPAGGGRRVDFALLGLLALLWGSSYPLIKVAVTEIPPLTLIASRVAIAALVLGAIVAARSLALPKGAITWRELALQAVFNSIGAWTVLAWGQQHTDAATAAVLNSTAPIMVFFATLLYTRHESSGWMRLVGALVGVAGVSLVVGTVEPSADPRRMAGNLAVLAGAALYACAAVYGRRFARLDPAVTAAGTMICATVALVPLALVVDHPWRLSISGEAAAAALALGLLCTAIALLIYFRVLKSLGSMAVASQAYLRASVGALLGVLVLGERLSVGMVGGIVMTLAGVVAINLPRRRPS